MPQLEQSSLQPSTDLQHRHLLQTTIFYSTSSSPEKEISSSNRLGPPPPPLPLDGGGGGGLRSQKGLRPFNPLQRIIPVYMYQPTTEDHTSFRGPSPRGGQSRGGLFRRDLFRHISTQRMKRATLDNWLSIIFFLCCDWLLFSLSIYFLEMFHSKNKYRNVNIVMASVLSIIISCVVIGF